MKKFVNSFSGESAFTWNPPISDSRSAGAGIVDAAAGAAGVGVGSAVNRLDDQLVMVAVVRGLRSGRFLFLIGEHGVGLLFSKPPGGRAGG